MTKRQDGVYRDGDAQFTNLFTMDRRVPVVDVVGLGSGGDNPSFANARGEMVWHLGLLVPASVTSLELPREKEHWGKQEDNTYGSTRDEDRSTLGVRITMDTVLGMTAELMSVYREYQRAFPVNRRDTRPGPTFRSR